MVRLLRSDSLVGVFLALGLARTAVADEAANLRAAVQLESPEARRKAADALAGRKEVTLKRWLELARGFGSFPQVEGGDFEERVRLSVQGEVLTATMHGFVPDAYDPAKPAPLLMAFHGSGGIGSQEIRRWRRVAQEAGMLVIAPTDPVADGGYTASEKERAAAWAALRWARLRFNVDENRVFATGVSRGGHIIWDIAPRHPDRFAALAPMIGGPMITTMQGRNTIRYVENLLTVPIRDLQGSKDDPRMLANLRLTFDLLKKQGHKDARLIEHAELGHGFEFGAVDWVAFFGAVRRDPVPSRVIRRYARKGQGRSFWVEVLRADRTVKESFPPAVPQRRGQSMSDAEKRRALQAVVDRRTGRLEVQLLGPGQFLARAKGIKGFRLLLTPAMFDPKKAVQVRLGAKIVRRRVRPSAKVLLREFVERFDRTFLPVAELRVP